MRIQPHDLRRRLYITYRGEEGLDYGGLARLICIIVYTYKLYYTANILTENGSLCCHTKFSIQCIACLSTQAIVTKLYKSTHDQVSTQII